jgi:hypothetical protein
MYNTSNNDDPNKICDATNNTRTCLPYFFSLCYY